MGAMANATTAPYIGWKELVVSSEKGRREVHYYLKRCGGGGAADLVVVGEDKSTGHMLYRYVKDNKFFLSNINRNSMLKLRSRKEVVDWLNSIVSVSSARFTWRSCVKTDKCLGCRTLKSICKSWLRASECPFPILGVDGHSLRQAEGDVGKQYDIDITKDIQVNKFGPCKTEFMWLGSSWTCRKRRRHYQSFCRNGFIVSVHDFVYVLAEENKRLVAYLDDIYEDSQGNKMAVVRWFHKIHEVRFVLPRDYNDREIFLSLCLQDLSIECIDGLAVVLSPEHYEKFATKAKEMGLSPFLCCREFDNDDVKPIDITRVKGYWKQAILKGAYRPACGRSVAKQNVKGFVNDAVGYRPTKRIRRSNESDDCLKTSDKRFVFDTCGTFESQGLTEVGNLKEVFPSPPLSEEDDTTFRTGADCSTVGSHVEVLSQDSGIRGCWFRALIIKKHKDKIKVQYQDIKDADNEAKNLEEWVLASRAAAPDVLGIRLSGRATVRPCRPPSEGRISSLLTVGSIVDAWWHDGWWEGIILEIQALDKLRVYFPGEKQWLIFSPSDLRRSQEWVKNRWQSLKEVPELASKLCDPKTNSNENSGISSNTEELRPMDNGDLPKKKVKFCESLTSSPSDGEEVRDLSKDDTLAQLKWKSTGKRRRSRSPIHKVHYPGSISNDCSGMFAFDKFFVGSSSLKFDTDNCKYASDFSSSVVPPLTSLVMSR